MLLADTAQKAATLSSNVGLGLTTRLLSKQPALPALLTLFVLLKVSAQLVVVLITLCVMLEVLELRSVHQAPMKAQTSA